MHLLIRTSVLPTLNTDTMLQNVPGAGRKKIGDMVVPAKELKVFFFNVFFLMFFGGCFVLFCFVLFLRERGWGEG